MSRKIRNRTTRKDHRDARWFRRHTRLTALVAAIVSSVLLAACATVPVPSAGRVADPIAASAASNYMTDALDELSTAEIPALLDAEAFVGSMLGPLDYLLLGGTYPLSVATADVAQRPASWLAALTAQQTEVSAWAWRDATLDDPEGYYETADPSLQPEAPYDIAIHGSPDETIDFLMLVDLDVDGSAFQVIDLGGDSVPTDLPTAVAIEAYDGATLLGTITFDASWTTVVEDRCTSSERSLTATSLELVLTAGAGSLSFAATAESDESTLSLRVDEDGSFFGLGFDVSAPDQFRVNFDCEDYALFSAAFGAIDSFEASAYVTIGDREVEVATTTALGYDDVPELVSLMLDGILSLGGEPAAAFDVDVMAPTPDAPDGTIETSIEFEDGAVDIVTYLDETFCPEYFCLNDPGPLPEVLLRMR